MLMGCPHLLASLKMASRNFKAGPNTPPPKIIFSGLNMLTRLATALPQYSIACSITATANLSFDSYAAKISFAVSCHFPLYSICFPHTFY
jgi:hypothetical protein